MNEQRPASLSVNWNRIINMVSSSQRTLQAPSVKQATRIFERPSVTFITGSDYTGSWNNIGMAGIGLYRLPHEEGKYAKSKTFPPVSNRKFSTVKNVDFSRRCSFLCPPLAMAGVTSSKSSKQIEASSSMRDEKVEVFLPKSDSDWSKMLPFCNLLREKGKSIVERKVDIVEETAPMTLVTGSQYEGRLHHKMKTMSGFGQYTMLHGVIYEGEMNDGMFHGQGTLYYPNGCKVEGTWDCGRIVERKFIFADGNEYEETKFNYCKKPDRRYATERERGLKPAGRSHITNQDPPRPIPDGCYDTGEGFYNPVTKCLMDPKTGEIKRIPTKREEEWIIKHCRKEWDENVGFRPDLYEDWFQEEEESSSDDELINTLRKHSRVESSLAFTPSMLQLMQEVVGTSDAALSQDFDSSGLLTISEANWIRPASRSSVDKDPCLESDISGKVNIEFGRMRESTVMDED